MRDVFLAQHPQLDRKLWHRMVPIGMHGDAGSFSKQESLLVISWNSLLGFGRMRQKRFVFCFLRKSEYTEETLHRLWKIFAWSLNVMLDGTWPVANWSALLRLFTMIRCWQMDGVLVCARSEETGNTIARSSIFLNGTLQEGCVGYVLRLL